MSEHAASDWSRRGLLGSRGLSASAGGMLGALLGAAPTAGRRAGRLRHTHAGKLGRWCVSRRAMACDFSVYLPASVRDPVTVGEAALEEIERMEDLLTIYRATTPMSYLNQHAAERPVRIEHRLFELLKRSAELTRQTGGAFDVSAGALVEAWGFFKGPRRVPGEAERLAALARSGMHHVELDDEQRSVRYRAAGLEINLGSIGKGYAIDRAAHRLQSEYGVVSALIQGGSSSLYGMGSPAANGRGWLVGIQNPCDQNRRIAEVRLTDRALGTSGSAQQHFTSGGRQYGHVLDPRTGFPADELASASALAADAATADALATAFFVMGLDKTAVFCQDHPEVAAVLVLKPGAGRASQPPSGAAGDPGTRESPRIVTFNLNAAEVDLNPQQPTSDRLTASSEVFGHQELRAENHHA